MLRQGGNAEDDSRVGTGVAAGLGLEEKASLTGGADTWHTVSVPRTGLPSLRLTDGPSGVRGIRFTGSPAVSLPCGTALAATWNRDLVRRVGELLGEEARRKDAHVLLAPTVNVHRHPLAGRNFECFSEDPFLSARMADAYITGVQSRGVGCAVKHLVANDQEHDRMEVSVDVDERTLREIYLPAFETAVRDTGVWAVMAAYNRLHGIHCSEHGGLLDELLRDEWGFDGLVMSDWFGTHSTLAVSAGLDLEMPGPPRFLGDHLAAAVRQGDVDEHALDRAADNVARLVERTTAEPVAGEVATGSVALDAASESIVLLQNRGALPLDPTRLRSLAVVGPKAERPDVQGGGSAHVDPPYVVGLVDGIAGRVADASEVAVRHEIGVPSRAPAPLGRHELCVPGTAEEGLLVEYFTGCDPTVPGPPPVEPVRREIVPQTRLFWLGEPAEGIDPTAGCTVRATADFVPGRSGVWRFGLASAGASRLVLDDVVVVDNLAPEPGDSFMGRGSTTVAAEVGLTEGQTYRLVLELFIRTRSRRGVSGLLLTGHPPSCPDALERAVAAAAEADAAVVAVGEDAASTEGNDRAGMDLPDDQVRLIRAVAAANPATVVVVNTGAPVTMDWATDVNAVVQLWYPGQEAGAALASVLFGDVDPSGRLPTTFPRRLEDTPAFGYFPGGNGRVRYREGLMVGYRHFDTAGVEPLFCFGHGLSYTEFEYGEPVVAVRAGRGEGGDVAGFRVEVELDVTNVGRRPGREVVQVYVHDEEASVVRPEQELKEFAKVDLAPGETRRVRFGLPWRAFAFWDIRGHRWRAEPGRFELRIGASSRAIRRTVPVVLDF